MITIDEFVQRVFRVSEASGMAAATVSFKLFKDGTRIKALSEGKDMGARRLEHAIPLLEAFERQYNVIPLPAGAVELAAGEQAPPVANVAEPDATGGAELCDAVAGSMTLTIAGAK